MLFTAFAPHRTWLLRTIVAAVVALCLLLILGGCGGGSGGGSPTPTPTPSSGPQTTLVVFAVHWADRSRAIAAPASALSLKLTLQGARPDGSDLTVTLDRTANAAAYTQNVTSSQTARTGTWQAVVTCYAQAGESGSVMGTGQVTVTIASDGTGIGDIAITGTVASVIVEENQSIPVGTLTDLAVTCRDSSGAVLTVSPGSVFLSVTAGTNNLQIVNGQAKGLLPGTATVQATVDGITSAPVEVKVPSSATFSIKPIDAILSVGDTHTFTAQVTNAPNTAITWSVQEGNAGGTVTQTGVYQAPLTEGTFHVIATSVYDPSVQAIATVTVQAIGTRVVYQNEFDGAVGSEWSQKTTETTPLGGRRFLGRFGPGSVSLALSNLPPHTNLTISFKLFIIRSWDGNVVTNLDGLAVGPDVWSLTLDGASLLNTTFGNWEPGSTKDNVLQSYPNATGAGSFPSRTGARENNTLGYPSYKPQYPGPYQDSVYNLTFTFPHTAKTATYVFTGAENQTIDDESWGIDSVQVTVSGR